MTDMNEQCIKIIYTILTLTGIAYCDLAIIIDKDGFTNVRSERVKTSEILGIIQSNDVFECFPNKQNEWWDVFIESTHGYVHKSRVALLLTYKIDSDNTILDDSIIQVSADSILIKMVKTKLGNVGSDNTIDRYGCVKIVPDLMYSMIHKLSVVAGSDTIVVPDREVKSLCNVGNEVAVFKVSNRLFITTFGGDGSEFYKVIWVIGKRKYIGREIIYSL